MVQRKEENSDVPEGFGKPQQNADKFVDVSSMIKKKRQRAEFEGQQAAKEASEDNKRLKLDNSNI